MTPPNRSRNNVLKSISPLNSFLMSSNRTLITANWSVKNPTTPSTRLPISSLKISLKLKLSRAAAIPSKPRAFAIHETAPFSISRRPPMRPSTSFERPPLRPPTILSSIVPSVFLKPSMNPVIESQTPIMIVIGIANLAAREPNAFPNDKNFGASWPILLKNFENGAKILPNRPIDSVAPVPTFWIPITRSLTPLNLAATFLNALIISVIQSALVKKFLTEVKIPLTFVPKSLPISITFVNPSVIFVTKSDFLNIWNRLFILEPRPSPNFTMDSKALVILVTNLDPLIFLNTSPKSNSFVSPVNRALALMANSATKPSTKPNRAAPTATAHVAQLISGFSFFCSSSSLRIKVISANNAAFSSISLSILSLNSLSFSNAWRPLAFAASVISTILCIVISEAKSILSKALRLERATSDRKLNPATTSSLPPATTSGFDCSWAAAWKAIDCIFPISISFSILLSTEILSNMPSLAIWSWYKISLNVLSLSAMGVVIFEISF